MAFQINWVPTPGQNNGFVTNNTGKIRVILDSAQNSFVSNPYNSPLYICIPPTTFQGGDLSSPTLYDAAKFLAANGIFGTVQNPSINYNGKKIVGGKFTLNGNPCGTYEYNILAGGTTLVQASVATLFSSTPDICSFIVCKGNLTLDTGATLIPTVTTGYSQNSPTGTAPDANAIRRLFMVVYVTGSLTLSSGALISMSGCGGNSDTTGANIASFELPVANSLSTGKSPSIGAAGTTPTAPTNATTTGITGPNTARSVDRYFTGGGGSGIMVGSTGGSTSPGSGGAGSCFSGGTGGGNNSKSAVGSTSGSSLGGAGGNTALTVSSGTGGTGNPGGSGVITGNSGTGGILIIIAESAINGTGASVAANGVTSGSSNSGGASGGGVIIQISGDTSYVANTYVSGGAGIGSSAAGGAGLSANYQI
jgi:hypothetical protein